MDEITINAEMSTGKPFSCGSRDETIPSVPQHEEKHEMMLTLPKSDIFVDDQTPTPTRLIRNCEEVGLFDDLRHVNPFDETFRRAVEQNAGQTPSASTPAASHTEDDTLHTPQVYPPIDEAIGDGGYRSDDLLSKPLETPMPMDVPAIEDLVVVTDSNIPTATTSINDTTTTTNSNKYRIIAEKPIATATSFTSLPTDFTLVQPQLITLSFTNNNNNNSNNANDGNVQSSNTAVPIQMVKPFILPKPITNSVPAATPAIIPPHHEPSSASMTPTSQLPIKERLKAILSHGSKTNNVATCPTRHYMKRWQSADSAAFVKRSDGDSLERKRAAATRYRHKMRDEQKSLRQQNTELKQENVKLLERVRQLEQQLARGQQQTVGGNSNVTPTAQIQIPAATVRLVMNIPTMTVSTMGQPVLQNPITYRVEKK